MEFFLKILTTLLVAFNAVNDVSAWDRPRNATVGQFPHLVSMVWSNIPISPPQHICGGVILNSFWILSSGYCLVRIQVGVLVLKVGRHDISADDNYVQQLQVFKSYIHPKYPGMHQLMNLGHYDLSLIKVNPAIQFNDRVKPAKLPKKDTLLGGQKLNYNLILSGWGSPSHLIIPNHSTVLQTLQVPIVDNRVCQNLLNHNFAHFKLHETQMCTRPVDGSTSACIGDYGGPLIQYDKYNEPTIIAIHAYSTMNCNSNNLPIVYSRVATSLSWIKKTMKL